MSRFRSKEAPDLLVTNDEIVKIAQNIEMSLFKIYPDCGSRYKAKCKAICFNIRDPKNDVRIFLPIMYKKQCIYSVHCLV